MRASLAVLALAAFTDSCLAWRGFDGFDHPADGGGSTLTTAPNTGGLGEPLNVIISGHSHAPVLMDQLRDGGFRCLML